MRESGAAMETDVLHRNEKFPERRNFRVLPPRRQQKINGENDEVGWHDTQHAAGEEAPQVDRLTARERREELAADQVAAENEEKIDPDPTEPMHPARQRETHNAGVINDDYDDGEGAEKVEPRLTYAIGKARVDSEPEWRCSFAHGILDARS